MRGAAILLDLGDYTHTNDQKNATPASGHVLDVDGRFPKMVKEAVKIRRELIDLALQSMSASSTAGCIERLLPAQIMCARNGVLLRVNAFTIARRYT